MTLPTPGPAALQEHVVVGSGAGSQPHRLGRQVAGVDALHLGAEAAQLEAEQGGGHRLAGQAPPLAGILEPSREAHEGPPWPACHGPEQRREGRVEHGHGNPGADQVLSKGRHRTSPLVRVCAPPAPACNGSTVDVTETRRPGLGCPTVRLVIAKCSVDYDGRLTAHLPLATRLLLVKADGSVLSTATAVPTSR